MANTIKLKTGSGSDPSASDLIVGEIAIRTDSGKLFTKKDNGTVAEISGSGGGNPLTDGDKGDITVSNGGDTFTIDSGVVTSAKIADGTIVNADISGSAAIAGSKLQAAGLVNAGSMSAANFNKLAGIEANATADMTGSEILSTISGENIILGEISSTGNSSFAGNVTISSSDGGSAAAPELDLYRISASPADADYLGQIKFSGESDDGSKELYAKITGKIGDASSGTEDGIIEIAHRKAGSNNISARFTSEALKLINGTNLEFPDNGTIKLGNSDDLQIFHNGTNSIIQDSGQGNLELHGENVAIRSANGGEVLAGFTVNSSVQLYFNNNKKLETSNTGVDITGNLVISGLVDGVDIAARDTLFGGLTSSSGVLTDGVTATTQSAGNSTTRVATTAFVSTAISNLVDSAPGTLNTLNELAAALGDDANFSTTVTNSIATKMPLAGGEFTGNVISHNITPDTDSIRFLGSNGLRFSKVFADVYEGSGANLTNLPSQTDNNFTDADHSKLDGIEANATADQTASEILTLIKTVDGAGSGLDADTLDGVSSASFLRSDADDSISGFLTITNDSGLRVRSSTNAAGAKINFSDHASSSYAQNGTLTYKHQDGHITTTGGSSNDGWVFEGSETRTVVKVVGDIEATSNIYGAGANITALNASNISSGTIAAARVPTLNQDTTGSAATLTTARTIAGTSFDGSANIDISYANLTNKLSVGDGGLTQNNFTNALKSKLDGIAAGATNVTNTNQLTNGAGFITATLTNEQVQDIVGGMVSSNTESGITVTYQDGDGTLDFAVASQTDNNFTNADHSKLDGIEAGATADQSNSEIKTAYEANSNTNAFTDALLSKLNGIAASATNVTNTNQLTNGAGFITSADGGNAATLDSIDSSQFARSDANDTLSGIITLSNSSRDTLNFSANSTDDNRGLAFNGRIAISADYNDGYLRLNNASEFGNGIYTPLVIRADGGFQVGGTTVVNGSAQLIASRLTGSLPAIDGSALTGIAAGATGGGSDQIFYENGQTVTTSYTITNGKNAMAAGPITINSGVTVTVGSGENLTIV